MAQAIIPLFAILIARILDPADFGLFAIATAIIGFVDIIKDLGISQAIIIEQDDSDLISMQFTVQFILGIVIYAVIFILSDHLASCFAAPALKKALMVYALMIFIYCVEYPLETFYMKSNKYNVLFYRQILPVLFYGAITYYLALKGLGVYALIIGHLAGRSLTVCFLLVKSGWKPKFYFDLTRFLNLFALGKHILTQSLCGFLTTQADSLVVGKLLGVYKLGIYRTANTLTHLLPNAVAFPAQKVIFSDIAQRKNDYNYYNLRYYQYFYIMCLVSFCVSLATYFLSPLVIPLIMGDKWSQLIPLVQLFSVALPTGMLVGINYDYSKILGFNHIYTLFYMIRAAATPVLIFIGSLFSLKLTVACLVVVSLMDNIVSEVCFFTNQKVIRYRNSKFIFFAFALVWAFCVIMLNILSFN